MHVKQIQVDHLSKGWNSTEANMVVRSKRLTFDERKSACNALVYGNAVAETFTDVVGDIGDMLGDAVKPITAIFSFVGNLYKGGTKIASAALDCSSIPFDEIKQIMDERFKEMNRKLDKQAEALGEVSKLVSETLSLVEKTRNEMNEGFERIIDKIESQEIKSIVIDINTFVEYFEMERKRIRALEKGDYINKMEEPNGFLYNLRNVRVPNKGNLHSALYKLLDSNNNFAIPTDVEDKTAFQALTALVYGTQTYVSIMFFLLEQHSYLAEYNYQSRNMKKFNKEFTTVKNIFDEFSTSLIGKGSDKALMIEVISLLEIINQKEFVINNENLHLDVMEKMKVLSNLKIKVEKMELPIVYDTPATINNVHIVDPVLITPSGLWKRGSTVAYAVQFVENGRYSKLSDWSEPFTVEGKGNPTLTLSVDANRRDRLIFRKFNDVTVELVGMLNGTETRFKDINKDLYNAAKSINTDKGFKEVKKLVVIGAKLTQVFDLRRTVLHAAAHSGNIRLAKYLKNSNFNMNIRDEKGFTPMHVACEAHQLNIINFLKENGGRVNAHTRTDRMTPLHISSKSGYAEIVQLLMSKKRIKLEEQDKLGFTALHHAVVGGPRIIELLTANITIDVNARTVTGLTPFHLAVIKGDIEVAKTLLESKKIKINIGNNVGLTALHFASMAGNLDVMNFLLPLDGIEVNAQSTDKNWTPLHFAIYSKQEEVARKLLKVSKIDISLVTKGGMTALHFAVTSEQQTLCEELLSMQADIEARTEEGYTPLHLAAMLMEPDLMLTLLQNKASIEAKSNDDSTPLHLAIKSSSSETASKLIEKNANIFAEMKDGTTPLHLAVSSKMNDLVSTLLDKKADMFKKDKNGLLPIHTAILNDDLEIAKIFVKFNPKIMTYTLEYQKDTRALDLRNFVEKLLIANFYDYIKNKESKKYYHLKNLTPYDVRLKLGKYDLIKILFNDPRSEDQVDDGYFNDRLASSLETFIIDAEKSARNCIESENTSLVKSDLCPKPTRFRRNINDIKDKSSFFGDSQNKIANNSSFSLIKDKFLPYSLEMSNNNSTDYLYSMKSFMQNINGNGIFMLLDVLVRKLTNEKYFKKSTKIESNLDMQAKALNIMDSFMKFKESVDHDPIQEQIDFSEVHSKVYKALKSGNEIEIPKLFTLLHEKISKKK